MDINFNVECQVIFYFANDKNEIIMMNYRRPQFLDDKTINVEAEINAKDMLEKKLNGAKELVAIAIARSETQSKDIMNKASKEFN